MSQQEVERELLAAEYVLGVLDPPARDAVAAMVVHDPDFADLVSYWERTFLPVTRAVPPVAPPARLWGDILAALDRAPLTPTAPEPEAAAAMAAETIVPFPIRRQLGFLWRNTGFWRAAALVAITLAIGTNLIGYRAPGSDYVAVLATPRADQPAFVVQSTKRQQVVLTGFAAEPPDTDHSYQLWAVASGTANPVALGVIPASGDLVINRAPVWPDEGIALLVSLEPHGGSKTGSPTGPVMFSGRLIRAR